MEVKEPEVKLLQLNNDVTDKIFNRDHYELIKMLEEEDNERESMDIFEEDLLDS